MINLKTWKKKHEKMFKRTLVLSIVGLLVSAQVAYSTLAETDNNLSASTDSTATPSAPTESAETTEGRDLNQLFSRVWQFTGDSAPNRSVVFLPNGTLLHTSCSEGYTVAMWTIDEESPQTLEIMVDDVTVDALSIEELSDTTLKLRDTLGEEEIITLTAVQEDFLCPL